MKRFLLSTTILFVIANGGAALAADLPLKAPPAAPAAVFDWTGFYVGLNAGYSWGHSDTDYTAGGGGLFVFPPVATSQSLNGWLAGGQAGYNWQFNRNWIVGVEADLQATGQNGTQALPAVGACATTVLNANFTTVGCEATSGALTQKLPWFGTARLRLGYLPSDRWMVYATGGLAVGEVETTGISTDAINVTLNGAPIVSLVETSTASSNVVKGGWTAGGGTEWAISGAWSAKLEYLHVDLGNVTTVALLFPRFSTSSHVTDDIVRVGLNYKFNWGRSLSTRD